MIYIKFLFLICLMTIFLYAENPSASPTQQTEITQQMLQGKVLQTIEYGEDLRIKFIPSNHGKQGGKIIFHFNTNIESDNTVLNYKLTDDGQILYYTYDGSIFRLKLIYTTPSTWIMLKYQDIDGDDTIFDFGKPVRKEYGIVNAKESQANSLPSVDNYYDYDVLYMEIYGRTDVRIASRNEYLAAINDFLRISSELLIREYKIKLKLRKIKRSNKKSNSISPKYRKLKDELGFIYNFYGRTIKDYDGNNIANIEELKISFDKAAKTSIQYQQDNYITEREREVFMQKLEALLDQSGTEEQKRLIKQMEINGLKYNLKYYNSINENPSIWCMLDQDISRPEPVFYPKNFVIKNLYKKYWEELSQSNKSYDDQEFFSRAKKIELESKILQEQFCLNRIKKYEKELNKWKRKYNKKASE